MDRSAIISPDEKYRYSLTRIWDPLFPVCVFIMLNPSTADGETDDATIRRCISFAKSWGYGGIIVVNLFALRSTDPKNLLRDLDPIGPDNDSYIINAVSRIESPKVICAWGDFHSSFVQSRAREVRHLIKRARVESIPMTTDGIDLTFYCLGKTKSGAPRHPVRLAGDTPLEVYL